MQEILSLGKALAAPSYDVEVLLRGSQQLPQNLEGSQLAQPIPVLRLQVLRLHAGRRIGSTAPNGGGDAQNPLHASANFLRLTAKSPRL
jgi:hypothetical protein